MFRRIVTIAGLALLVGGGVQVFCAWRAASMVQNPQARDRAIRSNGKFHRTDGQIRQWECESFLTWRCITVTSLTHAPAHASRQRENYLQNDLALENLPSDTYPPGWSQMKPHILDVNTPRLSTVRVTHSGFPCKCLASIEEFHSHPALAPQRIVRSGTPAPTLGLDWPFAFTESTSYFKPRVIPTAPLWPGIAINAAFYLLLAWPLSYSPRLYRAVRARRRFARGLCPTCAYILPHAASGPQVCPECGASAHVRA
jgi:hypothetical protein